MIESIVALFFFLQLNYTFYWADMSKRSWKHLALAESNTLFLFLMTLYCLPQETNWEFQPLYLLIMPVWGDVWVYTTHRLLHSRLLFHHIHYIHHEYMLPLPIDTFYAHPLENFLQNWCVIGIPLLFWPGFSTLSAAIIGLLSIRNALRAHNSPKYPYGFHVLHHSIYSRNLGAGFFLADKFFRSYTDTGQN